MRILNWLDVIDVSKITVKVNPWSLCLWGWREPLLESIAASLKLTEHGCYPGAWWMCLSLFLSGLLYLCSLSIGCLFELFIWLCNCAAVNSYVLVWPILCYILVSGIVCCFFSGKELAIYDRPISNLLPPSIPLFSAYTINSQIGNLCGLQQCKAMLSVHLRVESMLFILFKGR